MLTLKCKISIDHKDKKSGKTKQTISFDYVNSVVVKTSCKSLGDTATIVIPRNMREKIPGKPFTNFFSSNRDEIGDCIERGDTVTIRLGYEGYELHTVFQGYITQIERGDQLTVKCEDRTFLLKKEVAKDKKGNLIEYKPFEFKKFIEDNQNTIGNVEIVDKIKPIDESDQLFGDMDIKGHWRVDQALESIMKAYPYIRVFFLNDNLYITKSTEPASDKIIKFSPEKNIIEDKSLNYIDVGDLKMIVTASVIAHRDNVNLEEEKSTETKTPKEPKLPLIYKKISEDVPQETYDKKETYEQRVFYFPHSIAAKEGEKLSEKEVKDRLRIYATDRYLEFCTNRIHGSFKAFGEPFVQKGDRVKLTGYEDLRSEINNKVFIVDAVEYTFNQEGYRQNITLGYQIEPRNKMIKAKM